MYQITPWLKPLKLKNLDECLAVSKFFYDILPLSHTSIFQCEPKKNLFVDLFGFWA